MKLRETSPSFKAVIRIEGPKHNIKKACKPLVKALNGKTKDNSLASFPEQQEFYIKWGNSTRLKSEKTLYKNSDVVINVSDPAFATINGYKVSYNELKNINFKTVITEAEVINELRTHTLKAKKPGTSQ